MRLSHSCRSTCRDRRRSGQIAAPVRHPRPVPRHDLHVLGIKEITVRRRRGPAPVIVDHIQELLSLVPGGMAVLIVRQNLRLALSLTSRVLVMSKG